MRLPAWRYLVESRWVSRIASIIVLVVGSFAFFGWLTNNSAIKSIFSGVSPLSSFTFVLISLAVLLMISGKERFAPQVLAAVTVLIGVLRLSEVILGIDTGLDHLFVLTGFGDHPLPIAPNSALVFILIAAALLPNEKTSRRRVVVGQTCALIAALIASLALAGHIYNLNSLYTIYVLTPMSLITSCLFLLLCLAILTAEPNRGLTAILVSPTIGGTMARRLLPLAILVPMILSGLQVLIGRTGVYGDESDIIVFSTLTITVIVSIIWWNARIIDRADRERKQAEDALRTSEVRYRTLFESSSDAIMIFDEQGHYLDANPQTERLSGYSHDELLHMRVGDMIAPPQADIAQKRLDAAMHQSNWSGEAVLVRKDGIELVVDLASVVVAPGVHQSVFRDISERKQVEENLRQSLEQARELDELKSRFVSMVAHDFRTPLAVIQTSTDLLLTYIERMDAAKRQHHLEKIQMQIIRLIEMLNNILVIGKAQTVGLELHAEFQNVAEFCAGVVSELQLATPTHPIVFNCSGDCSDVAFDPKLLHQAITNLISNAVKYSLPDESVIIDLACGETEIVLRIQDHGIGIPEEDQKRLFEVFHRASNVGSIPGTGLGLPIVKQAIDAHHGTIQVESQPNAGTTFTITLPRSQLAEFA